MAIIGGTSTVCVLLVGFWRSRSRWPGCVSWRSSWSPPARSCSRPRAD